jgi:hypothetical protein
MATSFENDRDRLVYNIRAARELLAADERVRDDGSVDYAGLVGQLETRLRLLVEAVEAVVTQ